MTEENIIVIEADENDLMSIAADINVDYIEEDIQLFGSSDLPDVTDSLEIPDSERLPEDAEQWNLKAINLPEGNNETGTVKIGILDSGVNYTDDIDVKERVCFVPGEEEVSILWEDAAGHGTGIAGVIGAKRNEFGIDGINPNAELYSIRVLKSDNTGSLSSVISGIYWAIENDIDILNMSLGTTVNSSLLYEAVKAAKESGMLLIAAGGNEENTQVQYPAAYPQVMAVGGTNSNGELLMNTSMGTELEILAPGDQIITTGLFYGICSVGGTSIATAQVTGAASILWGMDKSKSADFIRQLMVSSARKVENAEQYGAGLLDIQYAMENFLGFSENYEEGENIDLVYEFLENQELPETFETEGIVNGLWSTDKHASVISGYAATVNNLSAEAYKNMNDNRVNIMVLTAKAADEPIFKQYPALHGTSNYVQSLKYLYTCATNLFNGQNIQAASNNAYNSIIEPAQELAPLKAGTELMLRDNTNIPGLNSDYTNSKVQCFKVLGFAMHCLGDTFAHRSYIMDSSKFESKDFKSTSGHLCDEVKIRAVAGDNTNVYCKEWNCFLKGVSLSCIEFRDVVRFTNMATDGASRVKYEDNPDVQPARFSDTKVQSLRFLEAFLTYNSFNHLWLKSPERKTILEDNSNKSYYKYFE